MTTFKKTKFKISDDQTNIDKYRLAANITEFYILSKLILQRIIIPKFMIIRQLFHVKIFQLKEEKWLNSVYKQENWALWFRKTFEVNFDI